MFLDNTYMQSIMGVIYLTYDKALRDAIVVV